MGVTRIMVLLAGVGLALLVGYGVISTQNEGDILVNANGFVKITDFTTNQAQNTFFASVSIEDDLPKDAQDLLLNEESVGFGYAWLGSDSTGHADLVGILANIHRVSVSNKSLDYWHIEPVSIEFGGDKSELCVFAEQVIGDISITENKINAVLPLDYVKLPPEEIDQVYSLELVEDSGCLLGFGGNVVYSWNRNQ